jgi:hypothetical protein
MTMAQGQGMTKVGYHAFSLQEYEDLMHGAWEGEAILPSFSNLDLFLEPVSAMCASTRFTARKLGFSFSETNASVKRKVSNLEAASLVLEKDKVVLCVTVKNFQKSWQEGNVKGPLSQGAAFCVSFSMRPSKVDSPFDVSIMKMTLACKTVSVTPSETEQSTETVCGWTFYSVPDRQTELRAKMAKNVVKKCDLPVGCEIFFLDSVTAALISVMLSGGTQSTVSVSEFILPEFPSETDDTVLKYYPKTISPIADFWASRLSPQASWLK